MGTRLPGDVQSTEDFWGLLINKKDGLCETPESRYNVESFYNPSQPRSVKTRKGYYLPGYLGQTDTSFWSNPSDYPGKFDPQQTLLMQVIWDCMENAGQVDWRGRDIKCYVGAFGGDLVGGLSGIGRSVATWMVLNGARNLIFFSRTAGGTESDQAFLKELEDLGCTATTVVGVVTKLEDVETVVSLSPMTGVIQMAAVLQDELLTEMSYEYWTSALAPKVTGTWNLNCALLNARLDFFLVFSSPSGWRGNNGQANYATANTFLDSFVQYRRTLGLPVSVITPGPMGGIGRVSSDTRLLQALQARGLHLLTERDILNGLKLSLSEKRAEPSPGCLIPGDFGLGLASTKPGYEVDMAHLHQDARFATFLNIQSADPQERKLAGDSVLQELALSIMNDHSLLEQPECRNSIMREVGKQINMYSSRGEDLSDEGLANLHIDSLMSLEIRYFLRRSFNVEISLMEISNAGTTGKLSEVIIKTLKAKHGGSNENPSAD